MASTADELGYLLFSYISHPHVLYASLLISEIKTAEEKKGFRQDRLGGATVMKGPWRGEHGVRCVPAGNASLRIKEHGLMVTGSITTLCQCLLPLPHVPRCANVMVVGESDHTELSV